jgi:cell division protein ZipA
VETGLRLVLLLVAVIIVSGIVWDTLRSRRKPVVKKARAYRVDRIDGPNAVNDPKDKSLANNNKMVSLAAEHSEDDENYEPYSEFNVLPDEGVIVKTKKTMSITTENAKTTPTKASQSIDLDNHYDSHYSHTIDGDKVDIEPASAMQKTQAKPEKSSITQNMHSRHNEIDSEITEVEEPQIFVINVMAKQPGSFLGKKLIDVFDEVHLFYGDMHIFHRYENADGSGKAMFSLASAVEPGIFKLENLESYVTPGLTLFFSSSTRNHTIAAFELMLRTAKILAAALDGEIKDQNRRPLTLEGIEKYRESVRKSVRLQRASSSKR